jgi:Protein of unknown function (DUF1360)
MSVFTEVKSRAAELARAEKRRYSGDKERPLGGYLAAMGAYVSVTGTLVLAARLTRRQIPDGLGSRDLLLSAVAAHKLSRLITKDPVTSPLRAPFTRYQGQSGPAELKEEVRGTGGRKTVGELLTCPFCIDMWVATGLVAGLVFVPRATRLTTDILAVLTGADLLQFGYSMLEEKEQA